MTRGGAEALPHAGANRCVRGAVDGQAPGLVGLLKLIVRANARRQKTRVLVQIREELEELKVLLPLTSPGGMKVG